VNEERVFGEPWEAQAFALTVALHERGVFTWPEWSTALAEEINSAQHADDSYYHHWLQALERLLDERGLTDSATLDRYRLAWRHAAERTPHGTPIELLAEDFAEHDAHRAPKLGFAT
jgi:nitrile hydratase accessory protein